jgi:CubicO group peptidase (beta-lactamase class C family)
MGVKTMKTGLAAVTMAVFSLVSCRPAKETAPLKTNVDQREHIAVLEKAIPALMETAGVPGMSIALIRDGKVVWSRGFGIKNTKTGEPVKDDTVFEAASLTKPFFAFLAMKFVENGKLDLDRPLITYASEDDIVKNFIRHPVDKEGFRYDLFKKITARMVLSHSSGLPHGEPRMPLPIFFEPGTRYKYSAEGYEYLQLIVEHLAGEPLDEIMRKMLIEPLQMKDSSMVWREAYESQAAVGHDCFADTTGEFRKRTKADAAATLYTTAADYAQFVTALMNSRGLKKNTMKTMLTPQINVEKNVSWSLGFGLEQTPNGKAFWQWGDYGIFRNYIAAYPEKKIGVVYLTNSENGLSIGQEILDLAIGGGEDYGLVHLKYPRSDSPSMTLVRTVRTQGVEETVRFYQEQRKKDPTYYKESDLNGLGYSLIHSRRASEAVEILKLNAEAFPDSANVYDSLAEAYMKSGADGQAVQFYKKAIEMAPTDKNPDKAFLESVVKGAKEKVDKLEKKISRKLPDKEAEKKYARFLGNWEYDVPGFGKLQEKIFVADGLLWASVEGGVIGERAEFIPVEGKPFEFKLDSPEVGVFDVKFIADDKGAVTKSEFYLPSANIKGTGFRKKT